jgi:hypothetical protein
MNLVWQDPPTPGDRPARAFVEEAAELRSHPKRWALIKTFNTRQGATVFKSAAIRGKKASFRPAGDWEFRVTGVDLYARFIGEDES